MKRLAILGSTGSVGESALTVVRQHPERLTVAALAAFGSRPERLLDQALEFRPQLVVVAEPRNADALADALPAGTRLLVGPDGLCEVAAAESIDLVLAAVVGIAGLPAVHAALAAGRDVALANKEPLVVAGAILMAAAARSGARLLPVDSEHAALDQALRGGRRDEVRRLVLTASGGPFRQRPAATFATVTPAEALAHPTWSMGDKITIDSATLMNKGLEVIEAHHLFDVPLERIEVVVHPQSVVHSLVEFHDGTWLAQLAPNDMVFPLQYALAHPERWENSFERLEPTRLGHLDFEPVDEERFPAIRLAREAAATGASGPAALSGANEVAVAAFLEGRLDFPGIVATVEAVLGRHQPEPVDSLEAALRHDAWARREAEAVIARRGEG